MAGATKYRWMTGGGCGLTSPVSVPSSKLPKPPALTGWAASRVRQRLLRASQIVAGLMSLSVDGETGLQGLAPRLRSPEPGSSTPWKCPFEERPQAEGEK